MVCVSLDCLSGSADPPSRLPYRASRDGPVTLIPVVGLRQGTWRRGVAPLTVSKIETREGNPTVETLARIAAALRVEVDALFAKPERA
jgi:hypothetical protein